jgi:DNA-binding transcriptional LysR family regulator
VVARDIDIRLLRHFTVVAEELHFSRAATKLYVAQQALSRDVGRLESQLGVRLFDRTTRRVTLTVAGAELLRHARPLLDHHDEVVRDLGAVRAQFLVDSVGEGITPARVLERARAHEDGYEFYSRRFSGAGDAQAALGSGEVDAVFSILTEDLRPRGAGVRQRLVREEPLALLLPEGHPLNESRAVRLGDLARLEVCWRAGNHVTAEWDQFARALLDDVGAVAATSHPPVRGVAELAHHVRVGEPPVLTVISHPPVPGTTSRPLVDPVPVVPWVMTWRDQEAHPGLEALHRAVDEAVLDEGWADLPDHVWPASPPGGVRRGSSPATPMTPGSGDPGQ